LIFQNDGGYLLGVAPFWLVACVTGHVTNGTKSTGVTYMCSHQPPCPSAEAIDREAARVIASAPEQGWSLLCNGVIAFDDTGELLPDGSTIAPHRGPAPHIPAARAPLPAAAAA
jgi:Family of unknown function (DUF5999)